MVKLYAIVENGIIMGVQQSPTGAVDVTIPSDFGSAEKPRGCWRLINNLVVFDKNLLDTLNAQTAVYENKRKFKEYLAETDWYVIRKMERMLTIPDDIRAKRLEAITYLDNN